MCRPPKIPAYADERTARRSVPATFVGWGSQKGAIKPQKQAKNSCCQARGERIHFEYPVGRFARLDEKRLLRGVIGNTRDFGSFILGSSPSGVASKQL